MASPQAQMAIDAILGLDNTLTARDATIAQQLADLSASAAHIAELQAQLDSQPYAALPTLSVADAPTKAEDGGSLVFTVTLSSAYDRNVTVNYGTANGTALSPQDYTATSGTLTFAPGETSKQVAVTIINDAIVESDEAFTLNLTNARIAPDIVDANATGTIANDDTQPPPPDSPPTGAFPTAATTGAKGTLTASAWPTFTAGMVIENKSFTGNRDITANNVTFRNCKFTGGWPNAKGRQGFRMEDCTVVGNGALKGLEVGNGAILRCDISGVQNGAIIEGSGCEFRGNYIHDLSGGGSDPHYDGMEIYGPSSDVVIEDNAIHARDTSCIFVANLWGAHNNVKINHNLLTGADMPCRTEGTKSTQPITNVAWSNNVIQKGHWGYKNLDRGTASQWSVTWTGNTDRDTGQTIP